MILYNKNRLQRLSGILSEGVERPESYSEMQTWLDSRPAVSKKVEEILETSEDGTLLAAEWLLTNFQDELDTWDGIELVEFLENYSLENTTDYTEYDYNDSYDGDFDSAMASSGFGTDEDYGTSSGDDW